ncbi:MAG TPA: N-acetylmuramoyl-L-alanine amidase, partial [Chloroflexota bacterium]|nr:N-acetylmuramoyl-L-alanine amidase [Chloroflexota bacterium]
MDRRLSIRAMAPALLALALGSAGLVPLLPVPSAVAASALADRTIVLNPEEGGSDPGGIAGGIEEKNINLPTTLDLGALLSRAGAHVVYTRSTDRTVSLAARADLANQVHADAFLTIAANALNDPNYSGATTYYGTRGGYLGGQTRSATLVATSRDLAQDVQQALVQATGAVDRGIKAANFYVLGYATMPSVLIETGFMTNPAELRQLVAPGYQETIAEGIASGLEQFFSGRPVAAAQPAVADSQPADTAAPVDATTPDAADAFSP